MAGRAAKSISKRVLFSIGQRSIFIPWLFNYARFAIGGIRWLLPKFSDEGVCYPAMSAIGDRRYGAIDAVNDAALNFYFRVAMSGDYTHIMELGALSAIRILELHRLTKTFRSMTKIYALDVTKDYAIERDIGGVIAAPNNLAMLRDISSRHLGKGLICATGTLCCYPQQKLADLFRVAASIDCDIALVEPNFSAWEGHDRASLKRSKISFYHPYVPMLKSAGYDLQDGGLQIPRTWNEAAEERTFIYARRERE